MRSFITTAALAAGLICTSLTVGYAQSTQTRTTDTEPGRAVVDTSTSTGSIVGDTSTGQPGKSLHEAQGDTGTAPTMDTQKSPCPSGLGTGNGDCR